MSENTLLLRLEGPMHAWGGHEAKFVIRRSEEAPTKSGVIGLLCAALGVSREAAQDDGWLKRLALLEMGVRIDRPGFRDWDWHTVGAGMKMTTAEGKTKDGPILSRREYLCDASFLVALRGDDPALIGELYAALLKPKWSPYLGRKACPPALPIVDSKEDGKHRPCHSDDLLSALASVPWRPRYSGEKPDGPLTCLLEWSSSPEEPLAPVDARVWYDVPFSFDPPAHGPRLVVRSELSVGRDGTVNIGNGLQHHAPAPPRSRADYGNSAYRKARVERLKSDGGLCVLCKSPAQTVQHVTYRHAGGGETQDDLRALCRLCHDACTMLEYGEGMELDRIDPTDPVWRERILAKRTEIVASRSLETRRRRLQPEEV